MKLDIYDFDKTVLPYDSGSTFAIYCFLRHPYLLFLLPLYLGAALLFATHIIGLDRFKKRIFSFIRFINLDKNVKRFWDKHEKDIHPWFLKENRERECVIISASPDFLLEEIAKRLEVEYLICTRHDRKSGTLLYENCKCEEKVRRFRELFEGQDVEVENVYSDSIKFDRAIFSLGKRCFHVHSDGSMDEFKFEEMYK